MSLRSLMQSDVDRVFMREGEFSEFILIKSSTGAARRVPALVYRDPLKRQGEDRGRTVSAPIAIEVSVTDWATPAVGDMVKLEPTEGADAEWMPVTEISPRGADEVGMHLLGVGR